MEKLQHSLQAVTTEEPPPMEGVAQRLGHIARSTLCSAISTRYLSYRKKVCTTKVEQSCQEVRQVALQLYSEGIDPIRSYITKFLSKSVYFRDSASKNYESNSEA